MSPIATDSYGRLEMQQSDWLLWATLTPVLRPAPRAGPFKRGPPNPSICSIRSKKLMAFITKKEHIHTLRFLCNFFFFS